MNHPSVRFRRPGDSSDDRASRLGLPADLEAVIMACLAKAPDQRPPTALALDERLAACGDGGSWSHDQARRWWEINRPSAAA